MSKDYHKGVKLQVYISEELNEKIIKSINKLNKDRVNLPFPMDAISKSEFIRKSLDCTCDKYLNER